MKVRKRLPPFAARLAQRGFHSRHLVTVAIGPWAWEHARQDQSGRVLVLPEDADPFDFRWPVARVEVLVLELGAFDTERLERTALALLCDRAACVRALRTVMFHDREQDPMMVFVPGEARRVA